MTLNKEAVKEAAHLNGSSEDFFEWALSRERSFRNGLVKLPLLRVQMADDNYEPVPHELVSMFEILEKAGVGKLDKTRNEFKWNTRLKEVTGLVENDFKASKEAAEPKVIPLRSVVVVLDNQREVTFHLPSNLSTEESKFLAKILERSAS